MGVLQRFERRLGDLVEGAFARVFRQGVQPVEIAAALQKEADDRRLIGPTRTLAPNAYTVTLAPADLDRLRPYLTPLTDELGSMIREHAVDSGYTLAGPISVRMIEDTAVEVGRFHVSSDSRGEFASAGGASPATPPPAAVRAAAAAAPPVPAASFPVGPAPSATRAPGAHLAGARTAAPAPAPAAAARVSVPGLGELPLTGRVVLGRGREADIQLADTSISRRHAELRPDADGDYSVHDLGSTNGTRVNDAAVQAARLVDGDRIALGDLVVTYHRG